MMNLVMRAATVEDQDAIRKMVYAARLNPMGLAWSNFIVVEAISVAEGSLGHAINRRLIGIGQLRPLGGESRELASLVVDPAYQGKGVGALLVHTLMRRATGPLYLTCTSNLINYYRRFGFVEVTNPSVLPRSLARLFRVGRVIAPLITRLEGKPKHLAAMVWPRTLSAVTSAATSAATLTAISTAGPAVISTATQSNP